MIRINGCLKNKLFQYICIGLPTITKGTNSEPRVKQPLQNNPTLSPTIKNLEGSLLLSDEEIATAFKNMKFKRIRYPKEEYHDHAWKKLYQRLDTEDGQMPINRAEYSQ